MTKEQLTNIIATRLLRKHYKALKWADVVGAVSAAGPTPKQEIVDALASRSPQKVGVVLQALIDQKVKTAADTEATAMLSDDTLTLAELEHILV